MSRMFRAVLGARDHHSDAGQQQPAPTIASIDADNDVNDTQDGVIIQGSNFDVSSGMVEVSNNPAYGAGTVVQIADTSWSSGSIAVTMRRSSDAAALGTLFTLPLDPAYLWVTTAADQRNEAGHQFALQAAEAPANAVTVGGDLAQWHTVELDIAGPSVSEGGTPNPFRQYRAQVTFTQDALSYNAAAYFAADGDAADSSASSGTVWRALFVPPTTGTWNYTVAFHQGTDAATLLPGDNTGLTTVATNGAGLTVHGATGSFVVAASSRLAPDLRAPNLGRISYVGEHHQRFGGDANHWFVKGGAGSPENFLGFHEVDGTAAGDHQFAGHVADWRTGDPTWEGGSPGATKGKGLIGALNYIADQGLNAHYFLLYNIDTGDAIDTFPWADGSGVYPTTGTRDRYDVSKLEQWRIVFEHANARGVFLTLLLHEIENHGRLDGMVWTGSTWGGTGALTAVGKVYLREMMARFGHLLGHCWILSEEVRNTVGAPVITDYCQNQAAHLRALDPWLGMIGVHNLDNQEDELWGVLYGNANFETAAHQSAGTGANLSSGAFARGRTDSTTAGRKWVFYQDEEDHGNLGMVQDGAASDPSTHHDVVRTLDFYPSLMAGGAGVCWYFGGTEDNDTTETFTTRANGWRMTRRGLNIMEYMPFHEMVPATITNATGFGFQKSGEIFALYLPNGDAAPGPTVTLGAGTYSVWWFNPRDNAFAQAGSTGLSGGGAVAIGGSPTSGTNVDWIGIVQRTDMAAAPVIRRFVLVNVDTTTDIGPLYDGCTVDLDAIGTSNVAVRIVTGPGIVGSVAVVVDGGTEAVRNAAPYASHGQTSGVYTAWGSLTDGPHTIAATAYSGASKGGTAGAQSTITINVVGSAAPLAGSFVDFASGSDSNPGTEASPWKTLKASLPKMNGGGTLWMRGGSYYEGYPINVTGVNGTAPNPIIVRNYPGEHPVIEGCYKEFVDPILRQTAWELYDGATNTYRSTATTYPAASNGMKGKIAIPALAYDLDTLVPYVDGLSWLMATSEVLATTPYYAGPGLYRHTDGRIYIRLQRPDPAHVYRTHTEPANLDPRTHKIYIWPHDIGFNWTGAVSSYITFDGIGLRGASRMNSFGNASHHLTWKNLQSWHQGFLISQTGANNLLIDNVDMLPTVPVWLPYKDHKCGVVHPAQQIRYVQIALTESSNNANVEIKNCRIIRAFDGGRLAAACHDINIHHNDWWLYDDGMQTDPDVANLTWAYNRSRGPWISNNGGGPGNGTRHVHHNICDTTVPPQPLIWNRTDPSFVCDSSTFTICSVRPSPSHSISGNDPWNLYNNTIICGANCPGTADPALTMRGDNTTGIPHRAINNIMVKAGQFYIQRGGTLNGAKEYYNGNCYYRSQASAAVIFAARGDEDGTPLNFATFDAWMAHASRPAAWDVDSVYADPELDASYIPQGAGVQSGGYDATALNLPGYDGTYRGAIKPGTDGSQIGRPPGLPLPTHLPDPT